MSVRVQKNAADNMDARLGALRSELETLEVEMKEFASDVGGIADKRVHIAIHKAEDVAHRAYRFAEESVSHIAGDMRKRAGDNLDSASKSIRTKPFLALALSIGAGALIGAIIMRR